LVLNQEVLHQSVFYRDENMESNIKGIYPIGEGAGYAGGIMSSAIDGFEM